MIDAAVAAGLARTRIKHQDPLAVFARDREWMDGLLARSCNRVGANVMVGDGCVLWGGVSTTCVGLVIEDNVRLYDDCRLVIDHLDSHSGIVLEDNVAMNFACYIEGGGGITIGCRSIFGPNVVVLSSSHNIKSGIPVQKSGKSLASVTIGSDVWIGANATILAGVTIGDRAVIGAGAVVTTAIPADCIAVGAPARVVRRIEAPLLPQSAGDQREPQERGA